MALVQSNPNAKTEGLAPKVAWISIAAIGLGVLLLVLDKLILGDDVPDEIWLTLIGTGVGAIPVGYSAPAALQRADTVDTPRAPV